MPGQPRPNKKAMKVAYTLLSIPDENRQDKANQKPSKLILEEWSKEQQRTRD